MAQLVTVLGAMLGFVAALTGFFLMDLSFLSAFAVWAVSGPIAAIIGFAMAGTPSTPRSARRPSTFDAPA